MGEVAICPGLCNRVRWRALGRCHRRVRPGRPTYAQDRSAECTPDDSVNWS